MRAYRLKLVTAPATEPVSVATMKDHSRIDISDDDALLDGYITAAREEIEAELKRALITQTWDLYLDGWPSFPLELPLGNLQSVTSITYYDEADSGTVYDSSNYQVSAGDPGRIALKTSSSLPSTTLRPLDGVVIRFVCGYGANPATVPDSVRAAVQLRAGLLYENREEMTVGVVMVPLGDTMKRLLMPNTFYWSRRGLL